MINGRSGSAAELIAGAMMDEEHPIVGGGSTYGKGTVQSIFRLDAKGNRVQPPDMAVASLKVTTNAFFPGTSEQSPQGKGIPPTTKVIYNDRRDKQVANRSHEGDKPNAIRLPSEQTRAHLKPQFTCTLDPLVSGYTSDHMIQGLAVEMATKSLAKAYQWNKVPTERELSEFFKVNPNVKTQFNEMIDTLREHVENFTSQIRSYTGHPAEKSYRIKTVMDADKLCGQADLDDGYQQIQYKGRPITVTEKIKYDDSLVFLP